ncbi:hypothetical protein ABS71_17985 [bacterium SCN 62-11]|nr:hypothetical protein [Candidatus Eremiobacteraeota bacterium]ODT59290.1 MAG: hypothetical protein ABS71_17985 [bacterium SCN 62-11]
MRGWFVIAALVGAGCSGSQPQQPWLQQLPAQSVVRPNVMAQLTGLAGETLKGPANWPLELAQDEEPRVLWITTPDGSIRPGRGRGFKAALSSALADVSGHPAWLKLDLVCLSENYRVKLRGGLDGVGFATPPLALLPDQVSHRTLTRGGKLRPDYAQRAGWSSAPGKPAFRLRTQQGLWADGRAVPLFRGHRFFAPGDLSSALLLERATQAGDFLVRQLDPGGRFLYIYQPTVDQPEDSYNLLRHAGCCYALAQLSRAAGQPRFAQASARGLGYLLQQCRPTANRLDLVEKGSVKLGGNALAVIAILEYQEVTGDRRWRGQALALGRSLLKAQSPNGAFPVHKVDFASGDGLDFTSGYYPGEAILALTYLSRQDPKGPWLAAARRAATYLIEVRDKKVPDDKLPHDHWLLIALSELQKVTPSPLYVRHMGRICKAICRAQLRGSQEPDWNGGFYTPPRLGPTSIRCEGLAAAREWLPQEQQTQVARALTAGVLFQVQAQLQPESCVYFPKPERALGAVPRSLTNFELRIDYSQHFISAMLGARRLFPVP